MAWALAFAPLAQGEAFARASLNLDGAWVICSDAGSDAPEAPQKRTHPGHGCCDLCCQATAVLPPPSPTGLDERTDRAFVTLTVRVEAEARAAVWRTKCGQARAPPPRWLA